MRKGNSWAFPALVSEPSTTVQPLPWRLYNDRLQMPIRVPGVIALIALSSASTTVGGAA